MAHHQAPVSLYYRPEMAVMSDPQGNFSKSPSKPRRFVEHLLAGPLAAHVELRGDFSPLTDDQLRTAHTAGYVRSFFAGGALARSNGLAWTAEFAESVRYTNGSLRAALMGALAEPARIALSPTSGFHHASPGSGAGFCTFSGQVIASLEAYRTLGVSGAWIDLDGHFGNSIEDSRRFARDLRAAVPEWAHVNPMGTGIDYLCDLEERLDEVADGLLNGRLGYVAFAHGADSHEWDDLGYQCTTRQWLRASELVYGMVEAVSLELGRPVPLVTALFGGYREDDPTSVLELHCADLAVALRKLTGTQVNYEPKVTPKE